MEGGVSRRGEGGVHGVARVATCAGMQMGSSRCSSPSTRSTTAQPEAHSRVDIRVAPHAMATVRGRIHSMVGPWPPWPPWPPLKEKM